MGNKDERNECGKVMMDSLSLVSEDLSRLQHGVEDILAAQGDALSKR